MPDQERLSAPAQETSGADAGASAVARLYLAVAFGSLFGSSLRWLVGLAAAAALGDLFPWGTMIVNVAGSFAIGFISALTGPDGRLFASSRVRQMLMSGVCGGFTTFSAFSLETVRLMFHGAALVALINIAASLLAWLGAVWLGDAAASRFNRLRGA